MILKNYIEYIVEQVILEIKHDFKWHEFKKLTLPPEMVKYLKKTGVPYLGEGSSRKVFLLSNRYVLKVSQNDISKGIAQNKAELDIFTDPNTKPIVAPIYDFDPKFIWIVSELVRPLNSEKEFKQLTGISFETFQEILFEFDTSFGGSNNIDDAENNLKKEIDELTNIGKFRPLKKVEERELELYKDMLKLLKHSLVQATLNLITEKDVLVGDLTVHDHWGKTASGKVVLLDYGYTKEVLKYY